MHVAFHTEAGETFYYKPYETVDVAVSQAGLNPRIRSFTFLPLKAGDFSEKHETFVIREKEMGGMFTIVRVEYVDDETATEIEDAEDDGVSEELLPGYVEPLLPGYVCELEAWATKPHKGGKALKKCRRRVEVRLAFTDPDEAFDEDDERLIEAAKDEARSLFEDSLTSRKIKYGSVCVRFFNYRAVADIEPGVGFLSE